MFNKHKIIDEFSKKKLTKETNFNTIVLGNGIFNYEKIKCTKCDSVINTFDKKFSIEMDEVVPACKVCGVDIFNSEFLPLDKNGNIIRKLFPDKYI